ncbi:MAG: C39 family peptidase [Lachnospiraceae bacterium]|nr:C39 family peptidase [Lachnospiraceae bacterium]
MSSQTYTVHTNRQYPYRRRTRHSRRRRHRLPRTFLWLLVMCILFTALILGSNLFLGSGRSSSAGSACTQTLLVRLENEGYPESLISLLERNPETEEFVVNYKNYTGTPARIDLSGEVTKGEIPLFLQWDERWGYETYGDDFLAVTGCGPTCLSMVVCGLSGETEWNPYAVACMAEEHGYYVDCAGTSWTLMSEGAESLGLEVVSVSFDASSILAALKNGIPIICSMGPGDFTTSGHFIVLTGVAEDGTVTVNDPNSRVNSEKTWDVESLMGQMKNLWGYRW